MPISDGYEQILKKIKRAQEDGALVTKLRNFAANAVYVPIISLIRDPSLRPSGSNLELAPGFADHRGTPREARCSDRALVRLIDAYHLSERDMDITCPPELAVRGLWAEWIHLHYGPLQQLLRNRDVDGLRKLLENVHRKSVSTGVGGTFDDYGKNGAPFKGSYYRSLWCGYRELLESVRPDWRDVASPIVGNPCGVMVNGRLIQVESFRHAHHATLLLQTLCSDRPARILEIGGGMGGQAYQFIRLGGEKVSRYTIFDLPEVACLSAYCLMAALGESRVRLFGEDDTSHANAATVEVLPHWRIVETSSLDADLIFNAYSFSEMDGVSSAYYLREVERICRRYFFHVNHETRFTYRQPDGSESISRVGSEMVPRSDHFELVWRRPRTFSRPENRANRGFAYLYQRVEH